MYPIVSYFCRKGGCYRGRVPRIRTLKIHLSSYHFQAELNSNNHMALLSRSANCEGVLTNIEKDTSCTRQHVLRSFKLFIRPMQLPRQLFPSQLVSPEFVYVASAFLVLAILHVELLILCSGICGSTRLILLAMEADRRDVQA